MEGKERNTTRIVHIGNGSVFKTYEGDIMVKLMNPEIPELANVSEYSVWAADIGNGHIKKFSPFEFVEYIKPLYQFMEDLLND